MRVQKITVKNLKAVSDLTADFKGCTAIITGKNDSGKSTFLKSLPERIRGNKPDVILKTGEKEGFAEYELTDGSKFIWTFDEAGEKLKFVTPQNIGMKITKEIAARYFPPQFDIDAFLQAQPKKQSEIMQKTFGVDFSEINTEYKTAFEARNLANNTAKILASRALPIDESLPQEQIDLSVLTAKLQAAMNANAQVDNAVAAIASFNEQIKKLEKELKILSAAREQEVTAAAMPKENTSKINTEVNMASELNQKITINNQNRQAAMVAEKAVLQAQNAASTLDAIERRRATMVESIHLPDGFEITDDGILYNGFLITREQLSSSGIYIASLKLASIGVGEVRVMHFDASFLDRAHLAEIEAWAESQDLQLLIERPDFDGGEITYELLTPKQQ